MEKDVNPEEQPEADEDENAKAQCEMESQLAKQTRLKRPEEDKTRKAKTKKFSQELNVGKWKPKTAVSILDTKKTKKIKEASNRGDSKSG